MSGVENMSLDEYAAWCLWHPGTEDTFSGYGIGKDTDYIIGLLMIDRPQIAPQEYLDEIRKEFGPYFVSPMTFDGCRGILCQMTIEEQSRRYVRRFDKELEDIILNNIDPLLEHKPKPHFMMGYSHELRLWTSTFYRGDKNSDRNKS